MKILHTLEPTLMPGNPNGPPEAQNPIAWRLRALVEVAGERYVGIFSTRNGNTTPLPEDLRELLAPQPADLEHLPAAPSALSASGDPEPQPALTA